MIYLSQFITDPTSMSKEIITSRRAIATAERDGFTITDGNRVEISLGAAINAVFHELSHPTGFLMITDDEPRLIAVDREGWQLKQYKTQITANDPSEFAALWTALQLFDEMSDEKSFCKPVDFRMAYLTTMGIEANKAYNLADKVTGTDIPPLIEMVIDEGLPLEDVLDMVA